MNYYLCTGLGVWLMAKVVDMANPLDGQDMLQEILHFLLVIFIWPFHLLGQAVYSIRLKKMEQTLMLELNQEIMREAKLSPEEIEQLVKQNQQAFGSPLDGPECPENDENKTDEGNV